MGAGAIGSVVGGFLAKAGHEVTMVGREWNIKSIAKTGLKIEGIWGEHIVPSTKFAGLLTEPVPGDYDFVLITVKTYDTETTAQELQDVFKNRQHLPLFVSMQNGIGNIEIYQRTLGKNHVAGARVIFGAKVTAPACVTVTVIAEPVAFGPVLQKAPLKLIDKVKKLAEVVGLSGIPAIYVEDIKPYLWAKVFYNSALNPLSAFLNFTYGELAENKFTRGLMDMIIDEAFNVAKTTNVKLFWRSAGEYKKHFYEELVPPTARHYASMLEDLKKGRTEIDSMNGAIVQLGKKYGVKTPVNEVVTNLIKALCEQKKIKPVHNSVQ